jgi:lactate dehydrogenase-like 2-hydroxyacid dehydrogenase
MPPHLLILGRTHDGVEAALAARCTLHRESDAGLAPILAQHGHTISIIISRGGTPIGPDLMDSLPALKLIALGVVGYDTVDIAAAVARGIMVTNTPDVLNDEMADFTVGLLIATIRQLPRADAHVRSGRWAAGQTFPLTASLRGRSIGIAGMGRIGHTVARRLAGFDLPIAYHARHQRPDWPYPYYADLRALAQNVDTLIVLLPGGPATRHAVHAEVLAALGPQGVLINVARGSVVDEAALITALQTRAILAAGLDVFAHEPHVPRALLDLDQVVVMPHAGTATHHTRGLMAQLLLRNVESWLDGAGAITPVPDCAALTK